MRHRQDVVIGAVGGSILIVGYAIWLGIEKLIELLGWL